jgi:hypothetical protein
LASLGERPSPKCQHDEFHCVHWLQTLHAACGGDEAAQLSVRYGGLRDPPGFIESLRRY